MPTSCRGLYRYCCSVWCVTMSSVSRMLLLLCSRDCMSRHTALTFSRLHRDPLSGQRPPAPCPMPRRLVLGSSHGGVVRLAPARPTCLLLRVPTPQGHPFPPKAWREPRLPAAVRQLTNPGQPPLATGPPHSRGRGHTGQGQDTAWPLVPHLFPRLVVQPCLPVCCLCQ